MAFGASALSAKEKQGLDVNDEKQEKDMEKNFKEYKGSFKFRRYHKIFAVRLIWWWFCTILCFLFYILAPHFAPKVESVPILLDCIEL